MPQRTVAQKMGVITGERSLIVDAPDQAIAGMALPDLDRPPSGPYDYIHVFVITADELHDAIERLQPQLGAKGRLWVSWPKGRRLGTDLTLPEVIRIGYDAGLVESTTLAIDLTWSGIKFTWPKPGKVYNNSYGTLPDRQSRTGIVH